MDLIPVSEMARRLHVCKKTAYAYLSPGGWLYHLRIPLGNRTVRVSREAFERFISSITKPPEPQA